MNKNFDKRQILSGKVNELSSEPFSATCSVPQEDVCFSSSCYCCYGVLPREDRRGIKSEMKEKSRRTTKTTEKKSLTIYKSPTSRNKYSIRSPSLNLIIQTIAIPALVDEQGHLQNVCWRNKNIRRLRCSSILAKDVGAVGRGGGGGCISL